MLRRTACLATLALVLAFATACTGQLKSSPQGRRCSQGLDSAYAELRAAKADGLGGSVELTKAASLLTAAKVQYEFEHYPNCIEKVRRARAYIGNARGG
jgi:hypothetical protein